MNLTKRLEVETEGVGVGGIRLKTTGNAVVLLGGPAGLPSEMAKDAGGARYAAIELLERLGCAWLWPGPSGKIVPRHTTVVVDPLDLRYTPSIGARHIRWHDWSDRAEAGLKHFGITREQMQAWQKESQERRHPEIATREDLKPLHWIHWQRLGGQMPNFGHAGMGLRDGDEQLKKHPEWFALQADGTRDQGGDSRWCLCLSNPDLIAHVADDIIRQVNQDPSIVIVSLDANDGGGNTGQCLCDRCRALDPPDAPKVQLMTFGTRMNSNAPARARKMMEIPSLTDRMVWYWSRVAERVAKVHPNLKLGISCYSLWTHPPLREKIHPNLVCRWAPTEVDELKGWRQAGLRQTFWRPNVLLFNRRDGKLKSFVGPIVKAMNTFADAGLRQTDFDSIQHNWITAGLSYYAAARLTWNPRLTMDAILEDYARHGFGPAAKPIKEYWCRVEELSRVGVRIQHETPGDYRYTPEVVAELRGFLKAAETAAAGDPAILERIAFLRMGLNYTELHETLDDLARRARAGEAGVDLVRARRLLDLHRLVLQDLMINHQNMALGVPLLIWGTGGFAKWAPLSPTPFKLSDESLTQRVFDLRYGQTGHEDSLAAMFKAFGMESAP
ncbi:MAG: DUF4838 domain-containing protein [Verrucomicrobiae bacterium]|nr:DUF4838 domain-containing protein [Verrucomicrobiae bacterium]